MFKNNWCIRLKNRLSCDYYTTKKNTLKGHRHLPLNKVRDKSKNLKPNKKNKHYLRPKLNVYLFFKKYDELFRKASD